MNECKSPTATLEPRINISSKSLRHTIHMDADNCVSDTWGGKRWFKEHLEKHFKYVKLKLYATCKPRVRREGSIHLGHVPAYYIQFLFNGCHHTSWYAIFAQCLVNVSEMLIRNQEDLQNHTSKLLYQHSAHDCKAKKPPKHYTISSTLILKHLSRMLRVKGQGPVMRLSSVFALITNIKWILETALLLCGTLISKNETRKAERC